MRRIFLILIACFLLSFPAAYGQLGVYAGFSASELSISGTGWNYGGTFGAYYTAWRLPVLSFGIDGRGSILSSASSDIQQQKMYSVLAGPRANLHLPALPFKPYAEGLIGVGHLRSSFDGSTYYNNTAFAEGFAGGVDMTFFPRLDWRVVEYSYTRLPGGTNENALTTGIVFRLPVL